MRLIVHRLGHVCTGDAYDTAAIARKADRLPSPVRIELGGDDSACRAAQRIKTHVSPNQAACRCRPGGNDQALAGDMNGLYRKVQRNDASYQPKQRGFGIADRKP